jgi:GTPase KRas protein
MRQSFGFLLVADLTTEKSLENLIEFIEELARVKDFQKYPCVLVLNKHDLQHERKVTVKQAQEFAAKWLNNCPVFETSAKDRYNVEEAFHQLVRECRKLKKSLEGGAEEAPQKKGGLFGSIRSGKEAKEDLDMFNGK